MNKVILAGHLGQDPEVRKAGNSSVTTFSIATSEKWKDAEGQLKKRTDWHNIEAWGKRGAVIEQYFKKGDKILIEGKIKVDTYEKDGQKRTAVKINLTEFHFVSNSAEGGGQQDKQPQQQLQEDGDDLPF